MKKRTANRILREADDKRCPKCGMYLEVAEEVTGYCFIRCPDYNCGWFYED